MSRPRKSEEEKKANKAAYMKEYWKTHSARNWCLGKGIELKGE